MYSSECFEEDDDNDDDDGEHDYAGPKSIGWEFC